MRDAPRSRQRKLLTFVAVVVCIGASFAACTQYKRLAGEGCLKDDDCISGICAGQLCATVPPMLPPGVGYGQVGSDASPPSGGTDSGADTGGGGDSGGESDSGDGGDGPAAGEGGADVLEASALDAADAAPSVDAADDGAADADDGASADGASDDGATDADDGSFDALELPDIGPSDGPILDVNLPG
jgi:hypothetical protein